MPARAVLALPLALCLAASLVACTLAAAPPASSPRAEAGPAATATAYAELAAMHPSLASYGLPTSLEDEISHTPVIVIGKVTGVGEVFNSARDGDGMDTPPSATYYFAAQIYNVQVERYLKGSGPEVIRPTQVEAQIRPPVTPTAEKIKAAKALFKAAPLVVGSRYMFLLDDGVTVPELGNLEVRGSATILSRFLLAADGTASVEGGPMEGSKADKAKVEKLINPGTEASLTARVVKIVADQAAK